MTAAMIKKFPLAEGFNPFFKLFFFVSVLWLFSVQKGFTQETLIDFNFQTATLPAGVTSDGSISTSGSTGSCTDCSLGRINIALSGHLQMEVASASMVRVTMKSSASGVRTVIIKYKYQGQPEFTTAGTVPVPGAGGWFDLHTLFPALVSTDPITIRMENSATGGQFHIHDLLVKSNPDAQTAAEIIAFKIPGQMGNESINNAEARVDINVPSGTPLAAVVPSIISISTGASITPTSGTARDFSGGAMVPYEVTAPNGINKKNWTVKVTEVLSDAKDILTFKLSNDQLGSAIINKVAGTILLVMPAGSTLTNMVPVELTVSPNATIIPVAGTARDFSAPVNYTVTAQNGTTKNWSVTVNNPENTFTDYQAEEAVFTGAAESNNAGFTGTGFVNFTPDGENTINFTVCQAVGGSFSIKFRYANGSAGARVGKLYVNEVFRKDLEFAPTGAWTTWAEEMDEVAMLAGINNIRINWDTADGPNLDKLVLAGAPCAKFQLTVNTTNSGTVSLSPARFGNRYFEGETATILAQSTPAIQFQNWSGDATGSSNPLVVTMNSEKNISANFGIVPTYTLTVNVSGVGQVSLSPAGGEYAAGTEVTLTATGTLGSSFISWSGAVSGNLATTTVTMDANKVVGAAFTNSAQINFENPVGFASVNTGSTYPEFNGKVTGGQNALDTFWVNGPADFDALAWRLYYRNRAYKIGTPQNGVPKAPLVIAFKEGVYPEGTSASSAWGNSMMTIQEQGDLTIIGEKNVVLKFGFNIKRSWNIIIRNLNFQDYYDDGINIGEAETHHIWIDHCTLGHPTTRPTNTEHPDGGIDSKAGASYITISWCLVRNSWKTSLVGHSDGNGSEDNGKLRVTYFANYFTGTNSRNPRVRFGEVHVLNNLNEQVGLYGIAAANTARVVAEGNFYLNTRWPMYADRTVADFKAVYGNNTDNVFTSKTGNYPAAYLKQFNNDYDDSGLPVITAQILPAMLNPGGRSVKFDELNPHLAFNPSAYYSYTPFTPSEVRTIVPLFAGADKVDFFGVPPTFATVTVNQALTPFTQETEGVPSDFQTYTVSGSNLTEGVSITPPLHYEVSADGGATWFSNALPMVLPQNGGILSETTIRIRLNATAPGNYAGNILHNTQNLAPPVNVPVNGSTGGVIVPPAPGFKTLQHWPLTENATDLAADRATGVTPSTQTMNNFYVSNGTQVPAVTAFSAQRGQAFGASSNGDGTWTTAVGGPGGSLNRNNYLQFTVTADAGYRLRVDSLYATTAFYFTSSNTRLGVSYSKNGFAEDFSEVSTSPGGFTSPITVTQQNTGPTVEYALSFAGPDSVVLLPGESLTFRLYYSCGSGSAGRYAMLKNVRVTGFSGPAAVLPLRLRSFTGLKLLDNIQLDWTTDRESNTSHFEVEKSTDGLKYNTAGKVSAQNTGGINHYRFMDANINPLNYYRLKMADKDGSFTYSHVVLIRANGITNVPGLYPNPATNRVMLVHQAGVSGAQITVTDLSGRQMKTQRTMAGVTQTTLSVEGLPAGLYLITIQSGTDRQTYKLRKE
jgi:pectate lyase